MSETTRVTMLLLAAAGVASLLLSLVLTRIVMSLARRIGFVDAPAPGGHKSHREAIPYGGGTAMFLAAWTPAAIGLLLAVLVSGEWLEARFGELVRAYAGGAAERGVQLGVILIGALLMHLLGLLDDRRPLGPWFKLAAIVAVAVATTTLGGVQIVQFAGQGASIVLTVLWLVVITNSFNFLDNMDGLSAGVAAICTLFLSLCGVMAGQALVPALGCLLLGAILGFLAFNFPPARVFMGDAGSLLLGYMIAVLAALTTYHVSDGSQPPYALAMPLVILAVPLYDFASVVVIRLFEGRNPLRGDQRHFSHRLVERGLSRRLAVLTIYLATAATGLAATLLPDADLRGTLTVLIFVLMVLGIIAILESPLRRAPAGGGS